MYISVNESFQFYKCIMKFDSLCIPYSVYADWDYNTVLEMAEILDNNLEE